MFRVIILTALVALTVATDFRKCENKPAPAAIRVQGCDKLPCHVIKGKNSITEVDFTTAHPVNAMTAKVRATALGITIPHNLPEELGNVCKNLMHDAYCPLDADEDVTYKLAVPIATYYPEVSVTLEISLVDDANNVAACFITDIQVRKN